jgi:ubiquinone/menaquinone biosynthesis C-methylase UbiE
VTTTPADRPGWLVDERRHAGRENLDPAHVARYDAKEDAEAAAEVALLQDHGLTPEATVVDLGAGTGQFTMAVAAACGRVIAVDVSPPMLQRLEAKVTAAGLGNVELVEAGFLTYEHTGPPVDVVYSRYALHHLPDFWKVVALARLRRLVGPGGLVRLWDVVYGFDPSEAEAVIEAWCATAQGDVATDWSRPELEEHVRDEHSTFTWLLEPMIERGGFRIERAEHSADRLSARYVLR